jgi:hypothetical protein
MVRAAAYRANMNEASVGTSLAPTRTSEINPHRPNLRDCKSTWNQMSQIQYHFRNV